MAKKALLRDHDNIEILPITRGELVLDSSGKAALHSNEFLASNSRPGLMSAEDKAALTSLAGGTIDSDLSTTSTNPVQNKVVTNAINSIKTSYLKSATVSTNTLTIVDQSNKETKFYNTTYGVVTQAADGLAPKLGTDASATIGTQADEWVLTSTKGSAPTWRKLPVNAFKNDNNNTTYTFASGNGGFTVTPSGGTAQTVSIGKPATAGTADKLVCEAASTNSFRHVWFSYDGEDGRLVYDNDFTYNPATNVLNVGSITGSAGSVAWGNITGRPDSFTPSMHNHTTEQITSLSNYKKATSASDLATSDTLNSALGKLEYTARYAYDWVIGVTATDTDEYINKWSEIVGFLDSVKEGTDILDEFVTRKTAQSITGAKTFDLNVKAKSGIDLYGATDYTNLPDSNFKLGRNKGLIHFRETNSTNYWGNAITWAYSDSDNAQAGIYVTTGGSYGSEMWFATTNLFDDGPKAALHINNSGDISAVRGKFRGTFVTTNGTSSQFVKGDGSLDNTTYATSASLGNYLPLTGGSMKTTAKILAYTPAKGTSDVYNSAIELREATGSTTSCTDNMYDAPGITFHWGGCWVHKLNLHANDLYWDNTKIWHAGNDGSGSGLDADLLDGKQFVKSYNEASDIDWSSLMWTANANCTDITSMSYAALMNVGTDLYRGWQIWNSRNDPKLYWRPAKGDASGWAEVRVLLDNYNYTTYLGYIGTTAVQSSSAVQALTGISRISNSTTTSLYLGNSGNQGWVMTQDICSHLGSSYWAINVAGTGWFKNLNIGYTYINSGDQVFNVSGNASITGDVNAGRVIISGPQPIVFTNQGSGTYNKATIEYSTNSLTIERARKEDKSSGEIIPLIISQRGGGTAAAFYGDNLYVAGNIGIKISSPENALDVNGIQQIYQRGNDNTAFKDLLLLKQQNSTEPSGQNWDTSQPSFGIGFRRYWTSGSSPYGETTHAGIYSTVSSNWKSGLVFRTKNNETSGGTHDTTALRLRPDGHAIFGSSIETNGAVLTTGPIVSNTYHQIYNSGSYTKASSNITGAIVIQLPITSSQFDMVNVEIAVYEYNSQAASKIIVGGHPWQGVWYNYSCSIIGGYSRGVRLGIYGGKWCVILGTSSTVWSYPGVFVTHIGTVYDNYSSAYASQCTLSLVTSESGFSALVTPTNVVKATYANNADTTDGVHIEWAGSQAASDTTWVVGWTADGTKLKAVKRADLSVSYANTAGSASDSDKLGGRASGKYVWNIQESDFNPSDVVGNYVGMSTQTGISSNWTHILSFDWRSSGTSTISGGANSSWETQLALPTQNRNGLYYRSFSSSTPHDWIKVIDSGNYTSYTVKKDGTGASGTWGINITGSAGSATIANMISHSTYYYNGNVMKNSTSADTIFGTSATANYLFPSFMESHPIFNNYADVINFTGYCMWGGTQFATEYNAINPRVAIRKYNQSRSNWGDWTEFITEKNNYKVRDFGNSNEITFHYSTGGFSSTPSWLAAWNGYDLTYVSPSVLNVKYATSAGTARRLSLTSCYNGTANNDLWSTIKSSDSSYLGTATIYEVYNDGGPVNYGHVLDIVTVHSNHWQPQLWFDSGKGGRLRYRNKDYNNNSWGDWYAVAFTSDIPSVGNGTVTITQAGTTIGSFTMNQSGNTTIALTDNNTNYYPIRSYTSGLQISNYSGSTECRLYVPYATASLAGVVSTGAQMFAGEKTFIGAMTVNNTITFGDDDEYGIRTLVNNFCRIGESGKAFYQAYVTQIYTNSLTPIGTGGSIGTSSKRYSYGYFSYSVYAAGGFYESSDERLKRILNPVKVNLDDLSKLRKIYYLWNDRPDDGRQLGMIAQDVQRLYPELVSVDKETGYLSLAYDRLSVLALEAIDTLYNDYKKLKERVDKLEKLLIDKGIS